jgi:hypothetical protein
MRRLILFFTLSLIATMLALSAFLANAQEPIALEPSPIIPTELINLRTENSETYNNHNGTRSVKVFSGKKYYKDNGRLNKIELSTTDEFTDGYSRAVRSGEYIYRFDPADKSKGYRFTRGSYYVRYIPIGDRTGTTSITTPTENGVKEDIIFIEEASTTVRWNIATNAAVSFYDGELTFTDADHRFLFKIPVAYAFDSAGEDIPVAASFTGDVLSYTLSIPEDVEWPVTLDPSTEITSRQDGRLHHYDNDTYQNIRDYENTVAAYYTELAAGQWYNTANTSYYVFRGFASFPIPALYSVAACTLYVNGETNWSTTDFEIYLLTSEYGSTLQGMDFLEFDGQQSGSAHTGTVLNNTWNTSSYSSGWNTIVFNTSGLDSLFAASDDTLRIAMISKNDYDNTSPTSSEEYVWFESSDHATDKPYLSISYVPSKAPYNLVMSALDSTSIICTWDHLGDNEERFYIIDMADSSIVDSTTVDAQIRSPDWTGTHTMFSQSPPILQGLNGQVNPTVHTH